MILLACALVGGAFIAMSLRTKRGQA
jgi:hypothetical protein